MRELAKTERALVSYAGLVFGLLAVSAPTSIAKFAGGTGRPDDPYQIATPAQLIAIGQDPNLLDKHFVLVNDLDLDPNSSGDRVFTRAVIAPSLSLTGDFRGTAFTGTFDGKGHKIKNLTIDSRRACYLGLFGNSGKGAEIRDLTLENVCVSSSGACVGGLVGSNLGTVTNCHITGGLSGGTGDWCSSFGLLAGENHGPIDRCDVNGRMTSGLAKRGSRLGLLAGANWGSIRDCKARGTIMGGDSFSNVGGLTGDNPGSIADSGALATISMSSTPGQNGRFGGLVGRNAGFISRCYAAGSVSCGMYTRGAGGLVGDNDGTILSCFAVGDVSGSLASDVGGLAGTNWGHILYSRAMCKTVGNMSVGGLVGANSGTISQSYSTGPVIGGRENWSPTGGLAGGLVGSARGGPGPSGVTGSFWDREASGVSTSKGGTALTSAQMKDRQTFLAAGWDFASERANGTADAWQMTQPNVPPALTVFFKGYQKRKLEGTGTAGDPYRIADAEDLGVVWQYDPGACCRFVADVNLVGITWTAPIIPSFDGHFDGNGRTVSNLTLRGDCFLGLFGTLGRNAIVEKLQVVNAKIIAGDSATGLGLLAVENWGRVTDCRVVGEVTGGSKDKKYAGILDRNYGTITNCEPLGNAGPYITIISDPEATRKFLRFEGIAFDDIWIPASKHLEGLDEALRTYLESDAPIKAKTRIDAQYVLTHFRQYNREYSGYVKGGRKHIICQMHLYDGRFANQPRPGFAIIMDGGCGIVRVIYDAETRAIVSVDCNGVA